MNKNNENNDKNDRKKIFQKYSKCNGNGCFAKLKFNRATGVRKTL